MVTNPAAYINEFGDFRLDVAKRLLLRDGEIVALTPKCLDILLVFVESGGELLSKDELMRRVWPDTFVEESNLTYNISVLRKVLGERAGKHQYIVTISGRGYRFVADVKVEGDGHQAAEGGTALTGNDSSPQQLTKPQFDGDTNTVEQEKAKERLRLARHAVWVISLVFILAIIHILFLVCEH